MKVMLNREDFAALVRGEIINKRADSDETLLVFDLKIALQDIGCVVMLQEIGKAQDQENIAHGEGTLTMPLSEEDLGYK